MLVFPPLRIAPLVLAPPVSSTVAPVRAVRSCKIASWVAFKVAPALMVPLTSAPPASTVMMSPLSATSPVLVTPLAMMISAICEILSLL